MAYRSCEDVFAGILKCLPGETKLRIKRTDLYSFFYEQRKDYPFLLGDITFRKAIPHPESYVLAQALNNLLACDMLVMQGQNPDLVVSKNCKKYKGDFSKEEKKQLRDISDKFKEKFAIE